MVAARLMHLMLLGFGLCVTVKRIKRVGCAALLARFRRSGRAATASRGARRFLGRLARVLTGIGALIGRGGLGAAATRAARCLGRFGGFAGSGTAARARRLARGLGLLSSGFVRRRLALSRRLGGGRRGQRVHRLRRGQRGGRLLEERAVLLHFELHRGAGGTGPAHHAAACTAAARCGRLLVG